MYLFLPYSKAQINKTYIDIKKGKAGYVFSNVGRCNLQMLGIF